MLAFLRRISSGSARATAGLSAWQIVVHAFRLDRGFCRDKNTPDVRVYLRTIISATAAADSTKLGGQSSAAALRSRCASFLFFFSSASSPP